MVILEVHRERNGSLQEVGAFSSGGNKSIEFSYLKEYLDSPYAAALSVSLPLRREPYSQEGYQGFFEGLVPEGRVRTELAHRFRISPSDYLKMLCHLEDESIGALVFRNSEEEVKVAAKPSYRLIDNETLLQLVKFPIEVAADLSEKGRFSLTGAQAKIGVYLDNTIGPRMNAIPLTGCYLPEGSAPSTHILKIPDRGFEGLPANEVFCLTAAKTCGINVCDSSKCLIGESEAYITKRYDRVIEGEPEHIEGLARPTRLHQEDFCQALGLPSYRKYEIEKTDNYVAIIASLLERASGNVIEDKKAFAKQVIFDYLIGNCDNHIKNFSFLYSPDWSMRRLAPAYDIVCTTILGYSREMGISVGDTRIIDDISWEDWALFAQDLGIPMKTLTGLMADVARRYDESYASALLSSRAGENSDVIREIITDTIPRLEKIRQAVMSR